MHQQALMQSINTGGNSCDTAAMNIAQLQLICAYNKALLQVCAYNKALLHAHTSATLNDMFWACKRLTQYAHCGT